MNEIDATNSPEVLKALKDFRSGKLKLEEPAEEANWLNVSHKIITGPRQNAYAHPIINFLRIGIRWSMRLTSRGKLVYGTCVDPDDVAWMMADFKIAREDAKHQDDNALDLIGYTECWQRLDTAMKQLGLGGMEWFRGRRLYHLCWLLEELTGAQD
jgi:hypothetical protein